tara:strand:+ start:240 stop:1469 length:1230 start_codon:yes stop_codon:yes gene_type:complete
MKILFLHQNFPSQFKFLAPALVDRGHVVFAMHNLSKLGTGIWKGVKVFKYDIHRKSTPNIHPWLVDIESKTIRGEACFRAALKLKADGFNPDLVIGHHGWGECFFIKEVWPKAKLAIYCEFFYKSIHQDVNFDPEFPTDPEIEGSRIFIKNINNYLHFQIADAGISPTYWQASTFPESFKNKITVIHDGIDTNRVVPNKNIIVKINDSLKLDSKSDVITFVNRNLEPYRGYHSFMRSLPHILKKYPLVHVLIVGGERVGYGAKSKEGISWKEIFAKEIFSSLSQNEINRIHFLGQVKYKMFLSILQISTVHVYLTYPFVLSWSLMEAMSAECAIVASNTNPLHEVIKNNETGILVDFFDYKSIAQNICMLLDNKELRNILSNNARKFIVENYDLNTICLPSQINWIENL